MSALVIDASVAVKLVVAEPGSQLADALVQGEHRLIAPDWVRLEVANALRNKVAAGALLRQDVAPALAALPDFFDALHETLPMLDEAVERALTLGHAVYDCLYLTLALAQDARLVTEDKKFLDVTRTGEFAGRVIAMREVA